MNNVTPLHRGSPSLPDGVDPHTDLGNAYRLVLMHGNDLRHCPELGWMVWDGGLWRQDERAAHRCMMDVAVTMQRAAALRLASPRSKADQDAAELDIKHARKSQSEKAIKAALALARNLEPIATTPDVFDREPMLLCVANGTVDLRTGELLPHRREDMLTLGCGVSYVPDAKGPVWDAFLVDILPDADKRAFLQRFAGYSASGSSAEQCFAILHGSGANGKSSFLEALKRVLGDYATEAASDTFLTTSRGRGPDNKLAALRAARLVASSESGEGRKLDETLVKRVTGGDELTANFLYKETFTYRAQFTLWMCTNHRPEIRGVDHGIWRRIRLIPFTVTVPPEKQDKDLPSKLQAEAEGILAWIVRGAIDWAQNGLQAPESVMAATDEWRAESNVVANFIAEKCVTNAALGSRLKVRTGALFAAYRAWASEQGVEVLTAQAFGRRLTDLGFPTDESRKYRTGLGLEADKDGER